MATTLAEVFRHFGLGHMRTHAIFEIIASTHR